MDIITPITEKELTDQATALPKQASPAAAEAHVAEKLEKFKAGATFDGTYVGSEEAEQRYADDVRLAYDRTLEANLLLFDRGHTEGLADVDAQLVAAHKPPAERDAVLHELRTLNLREQFRGRRLADVLTAYRATADTDNPTLVRSVEQARELWALAPDAVSDAGAATELQALIAERQRTREPKALVEQRAKLAALRTASLDALIRYARAGSLAVATAKSPELRQKRAAK